MQLPRQYDRREALSMMALTPFSLAQSVRTDVIPYKNGNSEFVVTADSGHYRAELVTAREIIGKPAANVMEVAEKTGAYACFNGGFFEPDYSPSGLFMRKGKTISPFRSGKGNGILYTDRRGHASLCFKDEFKTSDAVDATQLMMLRRVGRPYYRYDEKYPLFRATVIGLTGQQNFAGMVFNKTNYTLGDLHMEHDHRCTDVAMLDSGRSASAWSNGQGIGGNPDVANFLLIYRL